MQHCSHFRVGRIILQHSNLLENKPFALSEHIHLGEHWQTVFVCLRPLGFAQISCKFEIFFVSVFTSGGTPDHMTTSGEKLKDSPNTPEGKTA